MNKLVIDLKIMDPTRTLFHGFVGMIQLPMVDGYVQILASHMPLWGSLAPGRVVYRDAEGDQYFVVKAGGIVKVLNNTVWLLLGT